jgi:hypothetical protein
MAASPAHQVKDHNPGRVVAARNFLRKGPGARFAAVGGRHSSLGEHYGYVDAEHDYRRKQYRWWQYGDGTFGRQVWDWNGGDGEADVGRSVDVDYDRIPRPAVGKGVAEGIILWKKVMMACNDILMISYCISAGFGF